MKSLSPASLPSTTVQSESSKDKKIRELELDLAQTKLSLVQIECNSQEMRHELNSKASELQVCVSEGIISQLACFSVCLSGITLSVPVCLPNWQTDCPSDCLSVNQSVWLTVCLMTCQSDGLPVWQTVWLSVWKTGWQSDWQMEKQTDRQSDYLPDRLPVWQSVVS